MLNIFISLFGSKFVCKQKPAMSPPPLSFLSQTNSSHLIPQHRLQSSLLDSPQDISVKEEEEEIASSSSSSSNLVVKEEEEEEVKGGGEIVTQVADADQNGGYCTPTSPESRIPAAVRCPSAPKKSKMCRRRMERFCSGCPRIGFVEGLGLVVFKEVRCLRRRMRQVVRGSLAIAK